MANGDCELYFALTKIRSSVLSSVSTSVLFGSLGWGVMSEMLNAVFPVWLTDVISQFSFTTHFDAIGEGWSISEISFISSRSSFSC